MKLKTRSVARRSSSAPAPHAAGAPLRAVHLLGTLKRSPTFSHTETLCELLATELRLNGVASEIIRLVDHRILPGVETRGTKRDDWPGILRRVLRADILIFATPIWWGLHSSEIQRVVERMDALNDELIATGKSELGNKVGGIVITGAEDGAEHVIGNLCNFMIWNGLTMPPACSLSWLGDPSKLSKAGLLKKFKASKNTHGMARTMARNLAFFARLLRRNPIPVVGGEAGNQGLRG